MNLKKVINRKIDDKDSYALDACISKMYGDEKFGLYKFGYEEYLYMISKSQYPTLFYFQ